MASMTTTDHSGSVILTIVIPTFNRANNLRSLLSQLESEVSECEGLVAVHVYDNHSTDDTSALCKEYTSRLPNWCHIRHDQNIGPDLNFITAVTSVESEYFWMIGDDDLPRTGALRLLLEILVHHRPALVYIGSYGSSLISATDLPPIKSLSPAIHDCVSFAEATNIFTTFISAFIVSKRQLDRLGVSKQVLVRNVGTYLVQLGWVLPLIRDGALLMIVPEICLLATNGESWGGFEFLKVFCINYPRMVQAAYSQDRRLQKAHLVPYLKLGMPQRIKGVRSGLFGHNFATERLIFLRSARVVGHYKEFWSCTMPAFYPWTRHIFLPLSRISRIAKSALASVR